MKETPFIPPNVVEWLREVFPDRIPSKVQPKEQYDFLVGQQTVIRRLAKAVERQEAKPGDVLK